jgi:hypothetical protein
MSKTFAALAVCVLTSSVAFAQQPNQRTPIVQIPAAQADMMKLQMAMVEAQQKAMKPGDEALPCEALQKELVSTMTDPAIQAHAAKTNPAYAKELEAQQKKGVMTADGAAALAAALAPGAALTGGMPNVTPGQTPQQMQQAMLAQQQATIASMNQLMPLMPALMRGQRVAMLATMKNCSLATGGLGLYPPVAVPGNPAVPAGLPTR